MTFTKYQTLGKKFNPTKRELAALLNFVESQPNTCPKCGIQVFDPFGFGIVMHNVTHTTQEVEDEPTPPALGVSGWLKLSAAELRLRCGEMSAQEIRTVRAILKAIERETL